MSMIANQLRNNIIRANQIYFYGGAGAVDDSVYDQWKTALKQLAPNDPLLTQVGAPIPQDNANKRVRHKIPMGSLDKALTIEEFKTWHQGLRSQFAGDPDDLRYNVSYKADGSSVALYYECGRLARAVTRGEDGVEGEDITANALRFQCVPMLVNLPDGKPFTGSVRGEVLLFKKDWLELDPDQLSNPRNLGNGIARRQDGEDSERLRFVAFRLFNEAGFPFDLFPAPVIVDKQNPYPPIETESGMLHSLTVLGFEPVKNWPSYTVDHLVRLYEAMLGDARDWLPYEIDGLVIKAEPLVFQAKLGEVSNCPRSQIALKFPPRGASTVIEGVTLSLGHTGAIIPTADLTPVKIGGVTVKSALLCNFEEVERLGVQIGDTVMVTRQGDVIPKVIALEAMGMNRTPIEKPTVCPFTGGPVGHKTNVDGSQSVALYSLTADTPLIRRGKIERWSLSLRIMGLGPIMIKDLVDKGLLKTPADLYSLHEKKFSGVLDAQGQPVVWSKNMDKVLKEIDLKRKLTVSELLGSIGIDGLGKRRVALVQAADPGQFDTIEDWLSGKLVERAAQAGLPKSATAIFAQIQRNAETIRQMLDNGVSVIAPVKPAPVKAGARTFCITGSLSKPKKYFHELIAANGDLFEENYHKGLDFLCAADPNSGSSKMKKAIKDGVKIISEQELLAEIGAA